MMVLTRDLLLRSLLIQFCLLILTNQERLDDKKIHHRKMGDTNDLMEFLSASLGATLDETYQRLNDFDFTQEDPGLAMFLVALLNALGREGRGNRPTEVVLMLAFVESGTAEEKCLAKTWLVSRGITS